MQKLFTATILPSFCIKLLKVYMILPCKVRQKLSDIINTPNPDVTEPGQLVGADSPTSNRIQIFYFAYFVKLGISHSNLYSDMWTIQLLSRHLTTKFCL